MKRFTCAVCGKSKWSRKGAPCKPCRAKSGAVDPSQLVGAPHPKRIKKKRERGKKQETANAEED